MTVGVWVYFWVLCSVPLVCLSVLVPVPHCLDDCGFVILLEVWKSYASCLVFVSQDFSGFFIIATLVGVRWNFTLAFICISLMTHDIKFFLFVCFKIFFFLFRATFVAYGSSQARG